jgi:hypothetical protein
MQQPAQMMNEKIGGPIGRSAVNRTLRGMVLPLAFAACADGTLPASSAADPRDPRALETPFSAEAPAELQAPPPTHDLADAGHSHHHEGM